MFLKPKGISSLVWFVWTHVATTITLGTKQPSRHRLEEVVSARFHLNPEAVCFQCEHKQPNIQNK